jgi:hypothetical protein
MDVALVEPLYWDWASRIADWNLAAANSWG